MAEKKESSEKDEGIPEKIIVTDTLDLHGFFPEQVEEIVNAFIRNGANLGLKKLRIVHGKGKSRLKFEVYKTLKNNSLVMAFYDAPPYLGGWGATIVELKGK